MRVGWNHRYLFHCLRCTEWVPKSSKLLIFTIFIWVLGFSFSDPHASAFIESVSEPVIEQAGFLPAAMIEQPKSPFNAAIRMIDGLLRAYRVDDSHRSRVAESIVRSSRKYDVDPRLIASISIVESHGNPFAVSNADSIGIMQVHLPTWGRTALQEGINLFKIEDNIDFGVRILKNYIRRFGLWEGVKRYKGWNPGNPDSLESADRYVSKVQHIYSFEKSPAELLQ